MEPHDPRWYILFVIVVMILCVWGSKAKAEIATYDVVVSTTCGPEAEMTEMIGTRPGAILLATGFLEQGGGGYLYVNPRDRELVILQHHQGLYCIVYGFRFTSFSVIRSAAVKLLMD